MALAGIERSGLKLGDPLLICGAGPIGLVTLVAARAAGATPIFLTDLSESRLAFAKTLVPDVKTLVVDRGMSSKDLGAKIREESGFPGGVVRSFLLFRSVLRHSVADDKDFLFRPSLLPLNVPELNQVYRQLSTYVTLIRGKA